MLSKEEKIALADKISDLYFNHNFGTLSKSELEILLFSEYLDHLIMNGMDYDDYSISRSLCITQQRVRSLKAKKELKYPYVHDRWKELFIQDIKNAKLSEDEHHIKFLVQDINVLIEARHYVEENGWYDDYSLNNKLLNLPLLCFVDLFCDEEDYSKILSDDIKRKVSAVKQNDLPINKFLGNFTKDGLKSFLMSATKETLCLVLDCIPFCGTAKVVFEELHRIIQNT